MPQFNTISNPVTFTANGTKNLNLTVLSGGSFAAWLQDTGVASGIGAGTFKIVGHFLDGSAPDHDFVGATTMVLGSAISLDILQNCVVSGTLTGATAPDFTVRIGPVNFQG